MKIRLTLLLVRLTCMILLISQLHPVTLHVILDMVTTIKVFEEHVLLLVVEFIFALVVKNIKTIKNG